MDIAGLSMGLSQMKVAQEVGVSVQKLQWIHQNQE